MAFIWCSISTKFLGHMATCCLAMMYFLSQHYYLCQVNGVNGRDTDFVRCVSVSLCVCLRSGPVSLTSLGIKCLKVQNG